MTVPLERAPGIPALARGLATGTPDVSAFLPQRPDLGSIGTRARAVLAAFRPRAVPAGTDPRLAALARGEAAGVFTGQQVGLFGGPHLTLAKAVAAERLATDLTAGGTNVKAAFWCASEDHDLVEVTRVVLPTEEGPRDFGPDPAAFAGNRKPVGGLQIPEDAVRILEEEAARVGAPPDEEALAILREAHAGGTYAAAFRRTLDWLLGGALPFVDAADPAHKPALVPLAVRLVRERTDVRALLSARDAALEAAGHPPQVRTDPAALPLFVLADGERLLLLEEGGRFALKGREDAFSEAEVVARLSSGSWPPSFSALTRPLAASVLFPVGATVLGPSEAAYWAQAWPLFAWAGIEPPAVLLRPLVALETPAVRRLLAKLDVTLADVLEGEEALMRLKGADSAGTLLADVAGIRDRTLEALERVRPALLGVDAALVRSLDTTREKVAFAFGKLVEKTEGAAGRADAQVEEQVLRLVRTLLPNGQLAERLYSVLPYVLKLGRAAVIDALRRDLKWNVPGVTEIAL